MWVYCTGKGDWSGAKVINQSEWWYYAVVRELTTGCTTLVDGCEVQTVKLHCAVK